ncbi:MAG: hypothetical protein ACI8ZM_003458 [Crocinitomix sp.]|jgi:hypothetical protein
MNDTELYDQLIANNPAIERKGKMTPYTSINGHMFSFLSKEGDMGLRLSADDRATFMEMYNTQLMEQHGRVMKEYVHIPKVLFAKSDELIEYLQKSFDYVSQLKPKPSKKKK